MDRAQPDSTHLEQLIGATLLKVRSVDDCDVSKAKEQLRRVQRVLHAKGTQHFSERPRRGCLFEYVYVLPKLHRFLPLQQNQASAELSPQEVVPNGAAYENKKAAELWRECECLVLQPHSFAALRHIPELQQIIAHTAVTAVTTCAGKAQHLRVLMADQQAALSGSDMQQQQASDVHREHLLCQNVDLLHHLAPALRLYLAAEVAVGMLCPSQPAPPDTPEHAAALNMFIAEAHKHVQAELSNRNSNLSPSVYNTPGCVQQLWAHMHEQQQEVQLPAAYLLQKWPLLPHLDLQMQLPPHQLLQLLLELQQATLRAQQQQQQLQQQQQQQQEAQEQQQEHCCLDDAAGMSQQPADVTSEDHCKPHQVAIAAAAAAAAAAGGGGGGRNGPSSALPFHVSGLDDQQLMGLAALSPDLASMLEACCTAVSSSSSSRHDSSTADHLSVLLHACWRLSKDQKGTQQQQCPSNVQDVNQFAALLLHAAAQHGQQQQQAEIAAEESQDQQTAAEDAELPINTSTLQPLDEEGAVVLTGLVRTLATCLLLQFIQQQWNAVGSSAAAAAAELPAWQHEVPLQVLLLLQQVHQIEGVITTGQLLIGDALEVWDRQQQQQQQQQQDIEQMGPGMTVDDISSCNQQLLLVIQKVVGMIQMMRQFRESNAALDASVPTAENGVHSSNRSSSNGSPGMAPTAFFSAAGPLATGLIGSREPAAAAAAVAIGSSQAPSNSNSNGNSSAGMPQQQEAAAAPLLSPDSQQAVHQMLWQVLLATGQWELGMQQIHTQLLHDLQSEHEQQEITDVCLYRLQSSPQHAASRSDVDALVEAIMSSDKVQDSGNLDLRRQLATVCSAAKLAGQTVMEWLLPAKGMYLKEMGLSTDKQWERVTKDVALEQMMQAMTLMGCTFMNGSQFDDVLKDDSSDDDDAAAGAGSSSSNSSSTEPLALQKQLRLGAKLYRNLARNAAQLLLPLHRHHTSWLQQQQSSSQVASSYWSSTLRIETAVDAATGKSDVSKLRSHYVSMRPSSSSSSSSGVEGAAVWSHGDHDCNLRCPLCYIDFRQQQQKAAQADGSSHSQQQPPPPSTAIPNPYTQPAVSPADPFMWRRLLWQLLGKLSPAAQAFYAQYFAMCPHCMDAGLWNFVHESIEDALWSPPTGDAVHLQLYRYRHLVASQDSSSSSSTRLPRIKQYARALNSSFVQSYSPGMSVVAKQLLLSLSSLHQSVLSPADVAPYLPSSFTPAVGKLLQQQIIHRTVMDVFRNNSSRGVHLWHLWWHIGIRRYHHVNHTRQRQLQQQQLPTVDDMYLDPEARVYAVGFAARQLSGAKAPYSLWAHTAHGAAAASNSNSNSSTGPSDAAAAAAILQHIHGIQQRVIHTKLEDDALAACCSSISSSSANGPASAEQAEHCARQLALSAVRVSEDKTLKRQIQRVLSSPAHILAPAAGRSQQSSPSSSELPGADDIIAQYLDVPAAKTLEKLAVHLDDGRVQEQQQLVDPSDLCVFTDVSEVALLPPVAVDTLVDPAVWWQRQQEMLRMDVSCDRCGSQAKPDTQVWCDGCQCAMYCSGLCRKVDEQRHAAACGVVSRAKQRYAPPEPPPPGQQQSDPRVCEPSLGWMARLLQSLPGEGDSLSVCCGGIYNVGPAVLPKRIIVEQHKQVMARWARSSLDV